MIKHTNVLNEEDLAGMPGADLVIGGIRELHDRDPSECGLLVLMASPRLMRLGVNVPIRNDIARPIAHQLYTLLEVTHKEGAYSCYNSMLRRMASFCHSLEQRTNELEVRSLNLFSQTPREPPVR